MNKKIIFIGFMGAGKTYIGRIIAEKFALNFIDLDEYIESSSGMSINEIFMHGGERYFRKLERKALNMIHKEDVISTGAGIVESYLNREWLDQPDKTVIWLNPSWDVLWRRIKDSTRPKVKSLNEEEVKELWQKRRKFYEECAGIIYEKEDLEELIEIVEGAVNES